MIFVGVDAGGSKCRCRIQNAAKQIIGEAHAGPANLRLGSEAVLKTLHAACDEALEIAGLSRTDLAGALVCIGVAGIERFDGAPPFTAADLGCTEIRFETDALIANVGSHGGQDGGTVIVGTGSIGVMQVAGRVTRIGGHGFPVSDIGSGAHIGLLAIRSVLDATDGVVPETAFTAAVFEMFNNSHAEVLAWLDKATPTDFATLAPIVVRFANKADENAVYIIKKAADHVASMLVHLQRAGAPRLTLQGGLGPIIQKWLPQDLADSLKEPLGDPLSGALILAHRMYKANA